MKKLLGSALAIAMIIQPGLASAELLKNFKLSGQIDLQTNSSRNVLDFVTRRDALTGNHNGIDPSAGGGAWDDANGDSVDDNTGNFRAPFNDRLNSAQFRVLVDMDWDILDDVHAKITLRKNDRPWGNAGNFASAGNTGTSQVLTANNTGVDGGRAIGGAIALDQAYVKIDKIMGHVDTTIGRQFYGEPGDFVLYVGPTDRYGLSSMAFDAARVDIHSLPYVNIIGVAGKIAGTAPGTVAGADIDIRGLEFKLKEVENVDFDVFIYNRLTHAVGPIGFLGDAPTGIATAHAGNDNLYVYGFRSKVTFGGFTGKLKFALNGGENRQPAAVVWDSDIDNANEGFTPVDAVYQGMAWIVDAEYKADLEDIASFTPWIHMAWGSGRGSLRENQNEGFTAIANDYHAGTMWSKFQGGTSAPMGTGIPCIAGTMGCNAAGAGNTGTLTTPHGVRGGIAGTGLNNRVIWGTGLKVTPAFAPKLEVAFAVYDYRWQRITNDGVLWFKTTEAAQAQGGKTNTAVFVSPNVYHDAGMASGGYSGFGNGREQRHIGNEINIDLTWKHSDNVTFKSGVASFRPGKYIQEVIRDQYNAAGLGQGSRIANNPAILAYADMTIKF